jgi:hypothetical protein
MKRSIKLAGIGGNPMKKESDRSNEVAPTRAFPSATWERGIFHQTHPKTRLILVPFRTASSFDQLPNGSFDKDD